ncbi:MAG: UDP-N-acetylglucosamine 1-carboxyvinyltransferase [Bacilli bacterium]|nr:UDP-N-acetylglucosamine 1-carboxyvinyltransferase [Bacilli bacterium]
MNKIIIHGGFPLEGIINIDGSKNSVVALIPASILSKSVVRIYNYPKISDVGVLIDILKELNVNTKINETYLEIDSTNINNTPLITAKMGSLRASYYFMGALLGLFKEAVLRLPGGCYLGPRPIDLHLQGFAGLDCRYEIDDELIHLQAEKLIGREIHFPFPSVGATINTMLAAVLAEGKTIIYNAAKEPEIVDVANFLNQMGATIKGAGTSTIEIIGVKMLHGTEYQVIPDRIEAGTYLILGAMLGNPLEINKVNPHHLKALLSTLTNCGVRYDINDDKIIVHKTDKLLPTNIITQVYPGFPTDLQQIITTLLTQCNGVSTITETIYSDRFQNCHELIKMGANIEIDNKQAIIKGKTHLKGTEVVAKDLRGGASLVLAGLIAEGTTIIDEPQHILRGYSNIMKKLQKVKANIHMST